MCRRLGTFVLLALWYLTGGGCGTHVQVGPFVPADAIRCYSESPAACPVDYECRFPTIDSHAVCVYVGVPEQ